MTRTLLITVYCSLITVFSAHAETTNFTQSNFVIGMWWPPQSGDLDKAYKQIAEANFNLVISTPATNPAGQLKLCEKYGLQALVSAGVNDPLADSPALLGYYITDEPAADSFAGLAKIVEEFRQKKRGKLAYINLYPNYAPAWTYGGPTYDDYVAGFIKIVKPDVLSMDHYPVMRPDADSRPSYRANLETCRVQSLKTGIPYWNFFAAMPFNDRLDPTEAQLRWQIFTSIAYGAKGVLYFCYWTPVGPEFAKGGAVITAEGRPTRHYDESRRINAEIKNWGPTLMKLKSTGAYYISTTNATAIPSTTGLTNLTGIQGDPTANYVIGTFEGPGDNRSILIVNDDYSYTAWLTLGFGLDAANVNEVSKSTGKLVPVIDDSPAIQGLQVSFGAGDARLFVLPRK